jgi:hypothetical protein
MVGLFISLILLGLSAIDPIGIATMPILLVQKNGLIRSFIFLGGSFVSLMIMGFLFAKGLGNIVLNFEKSYTWFVPSLEVVAGLVLIIIAGIVLLRMVRGKAKTELSEPIVKRLKMGKWQLFAGGFLLVAAQSIVDVVFVVAMIHIGHMQLSSFTLLVAVATYAVAALSLQLAVIVAYKLAPSTQRTKTLDKVNILLKKYSNQALFGVSLLLGCVLLVIAF